MLSEKSCRQSLPKVSDSLAVVDKTSAREWQLLRVNSMVSRYRLGKEPSTAEAVPRLDVGVHFEVPGPMSPRLRVDVLFRQVYEGTIAVDRGEEGGYSCHAWPWSYTAMSWGCSLVAPLVSTVVGSPNACRCGFVHLW